MKIDLLAVSVADVEYEKEAGHDDADCGQYGHQNEQTERDDARRDLL